METLPTSPELFARFGAALGIGLLIGLQREYAFREQTDADQEPLFAGVRTFALMALLGCAGALGAAVLAAPIVLAAVVGVVGLLVATAYFFSARAGDVGLTTEVSALLALFCGALCYWGLIALATALAVAITVLLALKLQTQRLVHTLTREDVYATLTFAVISAIVLPVLPRTPLGPPPFDVLVPYNIWLMVVFISGISFLGYVLIQVVGARRGVGLTGLLGGLVSSTAVTLSFSQRSRTAEDALARPFGLAVLLAWTVMFARVLVEVAAINLALLTVVWIPITAGGVAGLAYCAYLYRNRSQVPGSETSSFKNPFELGPAITFGLLYAVILLVANVAQRYLGDTGIYLSSLVSGIADVDAITLSVARLSLEGGLDLTTAARAVVLAAASNTIVKGFIVLSVGAPSLRRVLLPGLILILAAALGTVFLM